MTLKDLGVDPPTKVNRDFVNVYEQGYRVTQSKKHSHYEITTNMITGLILGFLIVYYIFPIIGIPTSAETSAMSSVIFFVVSYVRSYTIRRIFNKLH
jgi:hypothetical protein